MSKNPFIILGVNENVTQNELFDAYKNLRNDYSNKRFEPGETGAEACKKLEEIEDAYREAKDILLSRYDISNYGDELIRVEDAIKKGDLDEAQSLLDKEQNRTAKWHYLQSVIFYRKNWYNDSLKQLEFACSMDPDNAKYKEAKEALLVHMNANSQSQKASYYNGQRRDGQRSYTNVPPTDAGMRGCTPCDCCSSLICADCCCECAGGDLISCC